MSLREALEANAPVSERRGRCKLAKVRDSLSDEDRDFLDLCLKDHQYTGASLARALLKVGTPVGSSTINAHRTSNCACYTVT